jgi:hypothetical protein
MQTQSFSADAVNLFVGTPQDALTGSMVITMKTARYYTDGSRMTKGANYIVDRTWGQMAVDRGWATDTNSIFPVKGTPQTLDGTVAKAVAQQFNSVPVFSRPYRIATWGQERADSDCTTPELVGTTRFTDIRSPWWFCAYRGDCQIVANYGIGDGGTGVTAVNWNSTSRSQGKTFASLAAKSRDIDAVLMIYGGTDIVTGNGTTPTAATIAGYLQANILAFFRLGLPVIFEGIYPYLATSVYRGVTSGWTAAGSGTAAQKQAICDAVNALMQAWIAQFPKQAVYVDAPTIVKEGGTYASKNYMVDGIELNLRGAMAVGKATATASLALLPQRKAQYFDDTNALTPNHIALLTSGFTSYIAGASTQGTVSWGTPTFGVDADYGAYLEVVATCSAITGLTAKNITAVTWSAEYLQFTIASHNQIPGQRFKTTGLTSSTGVDLSGPFTVSSNDSETTFSAQLASDPGTITIAGSPPSASSTIIGNEATGLYSLQTETIKQNGTPATGTTLTSGDLLQSSCWIMADDGSGGVPPLCSLAIRQRLYYQAGTPTYILSDGGIFGPTSGEPMWTAPLTPVRMVTTPMVSSNTSGGGSSNVSNASGVQLQFSPIFHTVGSARIRIYSPSIRAIKPGPVAITTPATGVAYTNKFTRPLRVIVNPNGATISAATIDSGDANNLIAVALLTGGSIELEPGDRLILTYSVATPILTGIFSSAKLS